VRCQGPPIGSDNRFGRVIAAPPEKMEDEEKNREKGKTKMG
jgi:hypothetical protein